MRSTIDATYLWPPDWDDTSIAESSIVSRWRHLARDRGTRRGPAIGVRWSCARRKRGKSWQVCTNMP